MNEPSPAWQPDPSTMAPPAPPAPPMPAPLTMAPPAAPPAPMPAGFALPAGPAAALDVTAPLAQPTQPAHPHVDHPDSLAMPHVAPAPIGGVAAASPEDLADLHASRPEASHHARVVEPSTLPPVLQAPGTALVLAMVALAWQLTAFYARVQLPVKTAAGTALDRFDSIAGALPLASSKAGGFLGTLLAAGAILLVLLAVRRGEREPVLYAAIGGIGAVALLAPLLLPHVAG